MDSLHNSQGMRELREKIGRLGIKKGEVAGGIVELYAI